MRPNDLLMIVSDHGFNAFNRGFHLNSWLHREGYLVLNEGKKTSGKWYADVDWSRSRAYGQGLNGIFLNLKGRESQGIVSRRRGGREAEKGDQGKADAGAGRQAREKRRAQSLYPRGDLSRPLYGQRPRRRGRLRRPATASPGNRR